MWTKHGALGSLAGYRSHLLRSPLPYAKSRCFGRCSRSVLEAAAQVSVFLRALSGPTCSTLLYARLRASSDIVIQSMPAVVHSDMRNGPPNTWRVYQTQGTRFQPEPRPNGRKKGSARKSAMGHQSMI